MAIITMSSAPIEFYDKGKDRAGEFAGKICKKSRNNSKFVEVLSEGDHFRWGRNFRFINLPEGYQHDLNLWSDWIGSKPILADVVQVYGTMAADLFAMWLDDRIVLGSLPLVAVDVLDALSIETEEEFEAFQNLMLWLSEVAKQQEIVVISWETASLGPCVGSPNPTPTFPFNRSWSFLGVSHPQLKINPENVQAGDYIVALKQGGFRSNGVSKVRKAFEKRYGTNWYQEAPQDEVKEALTPSIPYARSITQANGRFTEGENRIDIHWIAHLSGGSFHSKFFEPILAKKWLSATLENLYPIPGIALKCKEWLGEDMSSYEEMFKTRCCGQGMLVILPTLEEAEAFIEIVKAFGIDGQVAGQVTETPKSENPKLEIDAPQLN